MEFQDTLRTPHQPYIRIFFNLHHYTFQLLALYRISLELI